MQHRHEIFGFRRTVSSLVAILALGLGWGAPALGADVPVELAAVIEQARAEQLPIEGLSLKAQEGIAKGVPVSLIHAVMVEDLVSLGEARQAAPTLSADALPSAGRAVRSGASDGTVRDLAEVSEPARSYDAVADLLNAGLPEVDTLRLVRAAAAGRSPEAALPGLATAVSAMLDNGHTPEAVVTRLEAIVAKGGSPLSVLPDLPSQVPDHAAAWEKRFNGKNKAPLGDDSKGKGKN
jgi:hypothetical protein